LVQQTDESTLSIWIDCHMKKACITGIQAFDVKLKIYFLRVADFLVAVAFGASSSNSSMLCN
jgi:hypothetical protein